MSISTSKNGVISLSQNQNIFMEGETAKTINILTGGEIDVYMSSKDVLGIETEKEAFSSSFKIFTVPKNLLMGAESLIKNTIYMYAYVAKTESKLYIVNIPNEENLLKFFEDNKAYNMHMQNSIAYMIVKTCETTQKINKMKDFLKITADNLGVLFWSTKQKGGYEPKAEIFKITKEYYEQSIKQGFEIPKAVTEDFIKHDHTEIFASDVNIFLDDNEEAYKKSMYDAIYKMPADISSRFFSFDTSLSIGFAKLGAEYLLSVGKILKESLKDFTRYIDALYIEGGECLFNEYVNNAINLKKENKVSKDFLTASAYIKESLGKVKEECEKTYNYFLNIDVDYMKSMINEASGEAKLDDVIAGSDGVEVTGGYENIPDELKDSARKILDASGLELDRAKVFYDSLIQFRKCPDKFSTDDDMRKIRRGVTSSFFEIYTKIAKKVVIEKEDNRLYKMFLTYSFMDEKLLDTSNIMTLYKIEDKTKTKNEALGIHTVPEWLEKIYKKLVDPSVNGFGQDYKEALREMVKRGTIKDTEAKEDFESEEKRFVYEINNMISVTQRLCYGQISVYFPILHNDMITKDLNRSLITKSALEKTLNQHIEVDFSAFYREILYKNPAANIDRDLVMNEIIPNFILMPTFGSRAIMWQELAGVNKASMGRFLFPIFTGEDLDNLMIPPVGAFRWELCKNMLGPAWNDITQSSLTSDYSDYIQFFKKNKNLSDEAKEKVAIQVKKCRNSLREIFVYDYALWIKYESKGIMRLNKVSRNILYRHVPFSKNMRDAISTQPMFTELANRFSNIRRKKVTELENRYYKFTKNGGELPEQLALNLKFYKDM